MADMNSPRVPLTVSLPAELVEEIRSAAVYKGVAVDEVVLEACAEYTEPLLWEQDYKEWLRTHPGELLEFGIQGNELIPPRVSEKSA